MVSQAAAECKIDEAGHRDGRERGGGGESDPLARFARAGNAIFGAHSLAGWLAVQIQSYTKPRWKHDSSHSPQFVS